MPFDERLLTRAATIDELLTDAFDKLPGQKADSELAARRLAAWCRSSASGDWALFARRLERDGLSIEGVLAKFATVRRNPSWPLPTWCADAAWIADAVQTDLDAVEETAGREAAPYAFEDLLQPVVQQADIRLRSGLDGAAGDVAGEPARAGLRRSLLAELSGLAAPALYERFAGHREEAGPAEASAVGYRQFVAEMKSTGWQRLFEDKPVLLRLMATLTRQWIASSGDLITRLGTDLPAIRRDLLEGATCGPVTHIAVGLSDPHNLGRTVAIIGFEDGSRVVYKPKDLGVDAAWHGLIAKLNRGAPLQLRAVRVLPRPGYGWTEFVDHASCLDQQGVQRFFGRAGAWLALFHCFVSVDMHQENIIASGEHPVPIDLEMILQGSEAWSEPGGEGAGHAFEAAMQRVIDSVMTVGLLPAYGRYSNRIFSIGGVTSNSAPRIELAWHDVNSDAMRPAKIAHSDPTIANLPHLGGRYARLGDYLDDFRSGFRDYAAFLSTRGGADLFEGFAGLAVRRVIRPTRFYAMQLHRLRNHRAMSDGVMWSAQADFAARLADWERDHDPAWPLQRAERAALLELNVPHFVMASDGNDIGDSAGTSAPAGAVSGLDRARTRVGGLDDDEIDWQVELIRQNTGTLRRAGPASRPVQPLAPASETPGREVFVAAADAAAATLADHAVRIGPGAAWIGLDWLGDSEISQLVALGPDLYNGACGIALFLAAHAAATNSTSSERLAVGALVRLREILRGRNPMRVARLLGIGGGLGLGSVVYGLAVTSVLLNDDELVSDARAAAELISQDAISADRQLDVLGGSAGAILGLLRLYRQTDSGDALERARNCGNHLLSQRRVGATGQRCWPPPGADGPLSGMAHGAAGFAYALASLASATGADEFAVAATECLACENATFDADRNNWPDLRGAGPVWRTKWCYGAPGVGLARAAMAATTQHPHLPGDVIRADIGTALAGAEHGWPSPTDTLCCGTLGSIEFSWEAGRVLGRNDLREQAAQRLLSVVETAQSTGDYRWSSGTSRFNLGLFRGIAGVGYTALRRVQTALPNVLIWE